MIFVVVLVVSFFVSQFTTHQVDSHLFDDIMYIVLAGLGLTGAEKITDIFNK